MNGFTIEVADWTTDADTLLAIRFEVFVEEQGVPAELERDADDALALHLLASDSSGYPVATARMLDDGHIGRMAVRRSWRNRAIGSGMIRRLVHIAADRGLARVRLHAQTDAIPFYHRLGFEAQGGFFMDAGIPHRRMELRLDGISR